MSGPSAEEPVRPDIVGFLRARLDEDEAEIAKHPGDGDWPDVTGRLVATEESNYPAAPFLRIGKDRARREVEAKRRIVRSYEIARQIVESHDRLPTSPEGRDQAVLVADAWRQACEDLAMIHDSHPDYDPAWRPS